MSCCTSCCSRSLTACTSLVGHSVLFSTQAETHTHNIDRVQYSGKRYLYSILFVVPHSQGAQAWITQYYQQLRLCTVVSLRRVQVSAWGQWPSPLVWRHHMRHTVVQNSSGRQFVWCRRAAALNKLPASPWSSDSLCQFRRQLKTYCLSRTRLWRLLTCF